eukprot:bmy_13443T0
MSGSKHKNNDGVAGTAKKHQVITMARKVKIIESGASIICAKNIIKLSQYSTIQRIVLVGLRKEQYLKEKEFYGLRLDTKGMNLEVRIKRSRVSIIQESTNRILQFIGLVLDFHSYEIYYGHCKQGFKGVKKPSVENDVVETAPNPPPLKTFIECPSHYTGNACGYEYLRLKSLHRESELALCFNLLMLGVTEGERMGMWHYFLQGKACFTYTPERIHLAWPRRELIWGYSEYRRKEMNLGLKNKIPVEEKEEDIISSLGFVKSSLGKNL